MTWRQKLNDYIILPVVSVFRLIYSSGQSAFPIAKFGKYAFKKDSHPVTLAWTGLAITANIGVNGIVKIPAIYRELGHHSDPETIQPIALHTSGKCVSGDKLHICPFSVLEVARTPINVTDTKKLVYCLNSTK
jgi:hypothetical protein